MKVSLDDLDELISALSPEEMEELAKVEPDVRPTSRKHFSIKSVGSFQDSSMPASMRCMYNCELETTGKLDRGAMLRDLQRQASNIPDKEERVKFVPGTIRGKKVNE